MIKVHLREIGTGQKRAVTHSRAFPIPETELMAGHDAVSLKGRSSVRKGDPVRFRSTPLDFGALLLTRLLPSEWSGSIE